MHRRGRRARNARAADAAAGRTARSDAGPGAATDETFGRLAGDGRFRSVLAVTLIAMSGIAAVSPALPLVADAFAVTPAAASALIAAYTLPRAAAAPLLGLAADQFGRRRTLVALLWLFAVAGGACALARTFPVLVGLRLLQGIGGAALRPLTFAILADTYEGPARRSALGYNAAVAGVGAAAWPALGGVLALAGWRWSFALALAALPVGAAVHAKWPEHGSASRSATRAVPGPHADVRGRDAGARWASRIGGARAAWGAVNQRAVWVAAFAAAAAGVLQVGVIAGFLPHHLRAAFGSSSAVAGALLAVASATDVAVSAAFGRTTRHVSEQTLVAGAFAAYAAALAVLAAAPTVWVAAAGTALFGVGLGLGPPAVAAHLASAAPAGHRGAVFASNATARGVGQTAGPPLVAGVAAAGGAGALFAAGAVVALAVGAVLRALLRPPRSGRVAPVESSPH